MPPSPLLSRLVAPALPAAIALAFLMFASTARAAETPEAYVQSLGDRVVQIVDSGLDPKGRFEAFRSLIEDNTDLDRIADFAIGRYGQQMRDANQYEQYRSLFHDYVVRIYASRLGQYSGQKLRIVKSMAKGTDEVIVFSIIDPPKQGAGQPLAVNWRLSKGGPENFRIKDVQIAGAWMAIEQQSQFQSIISNNNRNPVTLIDYLQQQLKAPLPTNKQGAQKGAGQSRS